MSDSADLKRRLDDLDMLHNFEIKAGRAPDAAEFLMGYRDALTDAIAALERAERDAERWAYIRANHGFGSWDEGKNALFTLVPEGYKDDPDAAIDAAMQEDKP